MPKFLLSWIHGPYHELCIRSVHKYDRHYDPNPIFFFLQCLQQLLYFRTIDDSSNIIKDVITYAIKK